MDFPIASGNNSQVISNNKFSVKFESHVVWRPWRCADAAHGVQAPFLSCAIQCRREYVRERSVAAGGAHGPSATPRLVPSSQIPGRCQSACRGRDAECFGFCPSLSVFQKRGKFQRMSRETPRSPSVGEPPNPASTCPAPAGLGFRDGGRWVRPPQNAVRVSCCCRRSGSWEPSRALPAWLHTRFCLAPEQPPWAGVRVCTDLAARLGAWNREGHCVKP